VVCSVSLIDWKWGIIHGLADVYQNDVLSALLTGSRLAHLCNRPFWRGFDPPATLPMIRKGRRWQQPHLHAATVNLNDTTHLFCTIATLCSSTSPSILRHICYGVDDRRHMMSCLLMVFGCPINLDLNWLKVRNNLSLSRRLSKWHLVSTFDRLKTATLVHQAFLEKIWSSSEHQI